MLGRIKEKDLTNDQLIVAKSILTKRDTPMVKFLSTIQFLGWKCSLSCKNKFNFTFKIQYSNIFRMYKSFNEFVLTNTKLFVDF